MAAIATRAGTEGETFKIHAPLQYMSKADIAVEAQRLGLDAGMSWSCYDPTPDGKHCGLCDSCRLRHRGLRRAGCPDLRRSPVCPWFTPKGKCPPPSRERGSGRTAVGFPSLFRGATL